MKRFIYIIIAGVLVAGFTSSAQAQTKATRTSSARAAYGNAVPFRSHAKKNKKSKKKAIRSAEKKKLRNDRKPYRRGMPI
jgi:Ni/Co efflux regulator RcnB